MAVNFVDIKNFFLGSASTALTDNFKRVSNEFARTLYRDGSSTMLGNLDMNGRRIINHGAPSGDNDLATLAQVRAFTSSITQGPAGTSDNTYSLLALFKASPIARATASLVGVAGVPDGRFNWTLGDFSLLADNTNVIKADSTPLTTGAWVRQAASGLRFGDTTVTPDGFGAKGDGVADDTLAVQRALSSGFSIRLTPGKTYLVTSRLLISASNVSLTGGGTIKVGSTWNFAADTDANGTHLRVLFVTGNFVTISGNLFDATGSTPGSAVENGFIWSTGFSTKVDGNQFTGCPKGTCFWALSAFSSFSNNSVFSSTGAVFARGRNPLINANQIYNATDAAIAINGVACVGAVISGNTISNEQGAPIPSMIAVEEGPSNFVITGNALLGVNGGGIGCLNVLGFNTVEGGVISDNLIDAHLYNGTRPVNPNPSSLLFISEKYLNCVVRGNKIRGIPSGTAVNNSRMAILPATGTIFEGNLIDGTDATGPDCLVSILPGTRGVTIRNNVAIGVPPGNPSVGSSYQGRLFIIFTGDYGNVPVSFSGGKFYNAAEGINTEISTTDRTGLQLWIEGIEDSTCFTLVNAASAIGDRAAFLSAGAWARQHRIGVYTEMYGTFVPSNAGAIPFQNGDKIKYMSPTTVEGVVRMPGTWKDYGPISA